MKKAVLLFVIALSGMVAFAQKINKNELKQLQNFLAQPAEKDASNAVALKIDNLNDPSTWEGVTVANGHVTEIKWKDRHLAGTLNLSGFSALTSVDVSRNYLTGFTATDDAALTDLNVSRNRLTSLDLTNCTALTKVSLNNNRLTEFTLGNVPHVKNLNISNNYFVDLNLSNSPTLETLNCQGNRLENLSVDY